MQQQSRHLARGAEPDIEERYHTSGEPNRSPSSNKISAARSKCGRTLAALRRTDYEALVILDHDFNHTGKVMKNHLAFQLAIAKAFRNPFFELILSAFGNVMRRRQSSFMEMALMARHFDENNTYVTSS